MENFQKFFIEIHIMPKKDVPDPQAENLLQSLIQLGYTGIQSIQQGKILSFLYHAKDIDTAKTQITEMCKKLLVNPVIEDYKIKILLN